MTAPRPLTLAEGMRRAAAERAAREAAERRKAGALADRATAALYAQWALDTPPGDPARRAFAREAAAHRARAAAVKD